MTLHNTNSDTDWKLFLIESCFLCRFSRHCHLLLWESLNSVAVRRACLGSSTTLHNFSDRWYFQYKGKQKIIAGLSSQLPSKRYFCLFPFCCFRKNNQKTQGMQPYAMFLCTLPNIPWILRFSNLVVTLFLNQFLTFFPKICFTPGNLSHRPNMFFPHSLLL